MILNITLFVALIAYSIIVSQSFMYVLALRNTQLRMDAHSYIVFRHLVDANMQAKFRYVVYASIVATLTVTILTLSSGSGLMIGCTAFAFVALVADTAVTIRGNLPINKIMNTWSAEAYPADWSTLRAKWLHCFQWRQIFNVTGFVALVAGVVFG